MFAAPINLRALFLCLLVVAALGYAVVTSTMHYRPRTETHSLRAEFAPAYEVPQVASVRLPSVESPAATHPAAAAEAAHPGGPDVAPSAAPGVAFAYRYAFRLAGERIVELQEQHARACEQLGIHRCRITGMRYRVGDDRRVEAMLTVKLEPGIARRFGRAGADAVIRADGTLIEADVAGSDAGAAILATTRDIAGMREALRRLEQRLGSGSRSEPGAEALIIEAQQLRRTIAAAEAEREGQRESLATTPMVFEYAGTAATASAPPPSLAEATDRAFGNFAKAAGIVAIILVTLLPWALLALLGWLIARMATRRRRPSELPSGTAIEAP